jgi:hypothetical protein
MQHSNTADMSGLLCVVSGSHHQAHTYLVFQKVEKLEEWLPFSSASPLLSKALLPIPKSMLLHNTE